MGTFAAGAARALNVSGNLRQFSSWAFYRCTNGVIFNAWGTHGPERLEGEKFAILAYTSMACDRLRAPMRMGLLHTRLAW